MLYLTYCNTYFPMNSRIPRYTLRFWFQFFGCNWWHCWIIWFIPTSFLDIHTHDHLDSMWCHNLCFDPMIATLGLPVHPPTPRKLLDCIHMVRWCINYLISVIPSPSLPRPSQHQFFPISQLFCGGSQNAGVSACCSFSRNLGQSHLLWMMDD